LRLSHGSADRKRDQHAERSSTHLHGTLLDSHVSPSWQLKNHLGERLSVNLPAVMTANNGQFLMDAAIEGKGLILSPDFICAEAIHSG